MIMNLMMKKNNKNENKDIISKNGKCGKSYESCKKGYCCNKYGWCGKSEEYCNLEKGC